MLNVHHPAEKDGGRPEVPTPTPPAPARRRLFTISVLPLLCLCEQFGDMNTGVRLICTWIHAQQLLTQHGTEFKFKSEHYANYDSAADSASSSDDSDAE